MAKTICTILGIGFILVGLVGLFSHNFAGAHLNWVHNIIHLASGAVSLYFGLLRPPSEARLFAIAFGLFYFSLGILGFWFGTGQALTLHGAAGNSMEGIAAASEPHIFRPIPGYFELGRSDHILHLLLGALYLVGSIFSRAPVRQLIDNDPGV